MTPELLKLTANLESELEDDRLCACRILAEEGDATVLDILREVSFHDTVAVRYFARKAINAIVDRHGLPEEYKQAETEEVVHKDESTGEVHFEKELFQAAIQSTDVNRRLNNLDKAFEIAAEFGNEEVLNLILPQLERAETPLEKSLLIKTIGLLGSKKHIRTLTPFLKDRDYRVRADTIEALEYIGDPVIYPLIVPCLQDEDNRVKANAAVALRHYGKGKAIELLKDMLNSSKVWMRDSAAFALSKIKSPQAVQLLLQLLEKESKYGVYGKAVIGLSKIADRALLPKLKKLYNQEDDRRKLLMLEALVKSLRGKEQNVAAVLARIEARIAEREAALDAARAEKLYQKGLEELKLRHFKKAASILASLIKSYPRSQAAYKAQAALRKLAAKLKKERAEREAASAAPAVSQEPEDGDLHEPATMEDAEEDIPQLVCSLISDLSNPDEDVRQRASIKLMDVKDPRAIPYLEKAARDKDNVVRYYAKKALRELAREDLYHQPVESLSSVSAAAAKPSRFKHALAAAAGLAALVVIGWFAFLRFGPQKEVLEAKRIVSSSFEKIVTSYRRSEGAGRKVTWKGIVRNVDYAEKTLVINSHGYTYSATFTPDSFKDVYSGDVVEIAGRVTDRNTFGTVFLEGRSMKIIQRGQTAQRKKGPVLSRKQMYEHQRREYAKQFYGR